MDEYRAKVVTGYNKTHLFPTSTQGRFTIILRWVWHRTKIRPQIRTAPKKASAARPLTFFFAENGGIAGDCAQYAGLYGT